MRKLTREEWEEERLREMEEELKNEEECEEIAKTKPAEERLKIIRNLF